MKHFNPPHGLRRCTGGRDDQRGSAILLVLVAMVLMAILAGSLLQLTRFERIPRSESNIEVVIASVVDEIANQLTDDLLDSSGDFLNTQFTATNGGGDEPFDFPWTNSAVTGVRTPENSNGVAQTNVLGGVMDDSWLAYHMPDFRTNAQIPGTSIHDGTTANNTVGTWRKISSLTGLYLGGNAAGSANLSLSATPSEFPVSNLAVALNSDTNIVTNSGLLVDADGDGIGDARWEWAPLRQVGATQYVMAVRIVDLSARADVNVATRIHGDTGPGATSFSGANLGLGLPRGDSPADLDGSGFVAQTADATTAINGTSARTEWLNLLRYRVTGSGTGTTNPFVNLYDGNTNPPTAGSRREYWTNGASRVSNTFDPNGEDPTGTLDYTSTSTFGLTDAFELLQGNGLNSPTNATVEDLMPTFLRRNTGQEDGYGAGAGTNKPWTAVKDFWELDPRKHISPLSGSMIAAKPVAVGVARELKLDVNEAVKTAAGRTALRNRIDTFLGTNGTGLVSLFAHLDRDGLADQLAANIADYIDDDNTVTTVGTKTGFEALPYITEVYTQRLYDGAITAHATDATLVNATWTSSETQGYAIEIGNPFARYSGTAWVGRPISLDDVYISFDGGTTTTELSSISGVPTELAPGEIIYLYQNSTGNTTTATDDDLSSYYSTITATSNFSNIIAAVGPSLDATADDATSLTISLHATAQGGSAAQTWAYTACEIQLAGDAPTAEEVPAASFTIGQAYETYIQTSYIGIGEGLPMMAVAANPSGTNGYTESATSLTTPSSNTTTGATGTGEPIRPTLGAFAANTKTGAPTGFSTLASQQIVWPDNERERLHWIGDILQIPLIGPNDSGATNKTMADAFIRAASGGTTLANGVDTLCLPYQRYSGATTAPVVNNNTATAAASASRYGIYNYPHAVLLLEQLTTFSPASDGENGDGSTPAGTESVTAPNDDEVLVPGKLNLNTAPRETLVRLLPFPDLTTRQNIADAIIARRENIVQANATASGGYATGANGIPAIAYTAALYEQIENLAANPSQVAGDTTTLGTSGIRVDLNDYEDRSALGDYDPTTTGSQYPGLADGVVNDREEELMLDKWLTEVADTRSDVFAAYIVVQGFPVDNFTDGATESARLIVIFSRAGVKGTGDKAVEIGRLRIN